METQGPVCLRSLVDKAQHALAMCLKMAILGEWLGSYATRSTITHSDFKAILAAALSRSSENAIAYNVEDAETILRALDRNDSTHNAIMLACSC